MITSEKDYIGEKKQVNRLVPCGHYLIVDLVIDNQESRNLDGFVVVTDGPRSVSMEVEMIGSDVGGGAVEARPVVFHDGDPCCK